MLEPQWLKNKDLPSSADCALNEDSNLMMTQMTQFLLIPLSPGGAPPIIFELDLDLLICIFEP